MRFIKFNLLPFIILILILISIIYGHFSITLLGGAWYLFGIFIISISKLENPNVYKIYNKFFLIYLLFSVVTDYFYVTNPLTDFFYAKDSLHFFSHSNYLGDLNTVNEIFNNSIQDFQSSDWKGFSIIIGIVSYFSNFIDSNNLFAQKLVIVFSSALILPYLCEILSYYSEKAEKYTNQYGLLSYALFFSGIFLRDVIIGLLFVIIFYLFFKKITLKNLFVVSILCSICFLIRPEHGYFSTLFLLAYFFLLTKNVFASKNLFLIIPISIILFLLFIVSGGLLSTAIDKFQITSSVSQEYSLEGASSSSLGAALLKLPWGVKHFAAGLFSQILPFPFFNGLENGFGFIPLSVGALYWYFIWFFILLSNPIKRFIQLNTNLRILLLISLFLILLASSNVDTRRIMCVYPMIFVFYVNAKNSTSNVRFHNILILALLSYILLLFLYFLIK